jgi:hypothetical protein
VLALGDLVDVLLRDVRRHAQARDRIARDRDEEEHEEARRDQDRNAV